MSEPRWRALWRVARVAVTPRGALLTTRLADGSVIAGRNRPGWGGRGIFVWRGALEPELERLDAFLPRAGVFLDVGASVGVYTIRAARRVGGAGRVIALEPFPDAFAMLAHNVGANRLDNVRLHRAAAAATTGSGTLWLNRRRPSLFSLVRHDAHAEALAVRTVTIDQLAAEENLERLDYLKIDAEGAEAAILAGATATIARRRPVVQIEIGAWRFDATGYAAFRAPRSPNVVHVPDEHPAARLPAALGWQRVG